MVPFPSFASALRMSMGVTIPRAMAGERKSSREAVRAPISTMCICFARTMETTSPARLTARIQQDVSHSSLRTIGSTGCLSAILPPQ